MCQVGCEVHVLPTYNMSEDLVVRKIKLGLILNEVDYDTIVKDAIEFTEVGSEFVENDERFDYIETKYGFKFNLSKLNQARERYYANSQQD